MRVGCAEMTDNYRAALLISSQREDRRVLFNTFDQMGFDATYTARDCDHGQALLEQDPKIGLIVLDFFDVDSARDWCQKMASGASKRPVIGIVPPGSELDLSKFAPVVVEWLRSPVLASELRYRMRLMQQAQSERRNEVRTLPPRIDPWTVMLADSMRVGVATREMWEWTDRAVAELELDLLMVLGDSNNDEPSLLAAQSRLDMKATFPPVWEQDIYRRINGGEPVFHQNDADQHISCPVVNRLQLKSFIGMPLIGDKKTPIGTLMLGSKKPIVDFESARVVCASIAQRFALEHLVTRYRFDSRFHGLHDGLTRLPNRLLFNDRLLAALAEAKRGSERLAILFIDLDRFKNINDSLGHAVGDQVLLSVAGRLQTGVRASDTVCRYAGDEFTVLLRHVSSAHDVGRIAEKLLQLMQAPLTLIDGAELHLTASIGIAFYPEDGLNAEELLRRADAAMYGAKNMGRNRFQVYKNDGDESQRQRMTLESKLRVAEKNKELRAFYQPKVDTVSEDIVGMEALIRWEHPELGLISPGFFIPLAEETGLIVSMGEWVLRTSCIDAQLWQQRYGLKLKVSVNLSALQLKQPNLLQVVKDALQVSNLPANLLDLEITESMNLREIPQLIETLSQVRRLGCSVSIDDFGTGQSSLEYLKKFPTDYIKIDQTFVRNIGVDPGDEAIIRATIEMAHGLGLKVIAEGVETEDHLNFLRAHHCEQLQGFLFSRPLPALLFDQLLAEREKMLAAV
jgi:diguanylate cyclase (GGDEF)-like protein